MKPRHASTVMRTLRPKSPRWASPCSVTISLVRCGSSVVETAWKSCSGARAIISTAKISAASESLPVSAFTISTPEFRIACSETMITSTALANPSPRDSVNSGSPEVERSPREEARRTCLPSANGTTIKLSSGAAAIATPAAFGPWMTPTASKTPNTTRDVDSISTSPP